MTAEPVTDTSVSTEETRYLASQWRLFWWKFCDHRLARAALWFLVALYLMAALCEVIAPNDPNRRDTTRKLASPQRIHIVHNGAAHWPFVYRQTQHVNPETLAPIVIAKIPLKPLSIRVFPKGDPYDFWGY